MGQRLFDRLGRGLQLTEAGRLVMAHFTGLQGHYMPICAAAARKAPHVGQDELSFKPIAEESLSLVVSPNHPLASKVQVSWGDLMRFPWVLQNRGSPMRDVLDQEFRSHNTRVPVGLIETSSILTTTNLLTHSEMIAVIPTEVAERYEKHGMLVCLKYSLGQQLSIYGLITAKGRPQTPPATHLIALIEGRSA